MGVRKHITCPFCGEQMIHEDYTGGGYVCEYCGESITYRQRNMTLEQIDEDRCSTTPYRSSVPRGCRACGGPYPDCMTSCRLYDD